MILHKEEPIFLIKTHTDYCFAESLMHTSLIVTIVADIFFLVLPCGLGLPPSQYARSIGKKGLERGLTIVSRTALALATVHLIYGTEDGHIPFKTGLTQQKYNLFVIFFF